jgi:CheY-like chemotaxis protein
MTPPSGYDVLLVDDDPYVRLVIGAEIEADGHRVWPAACANDAIERTAGQSFHVALIDFEMPRMNGLQLARELRARGSVARIALFSGRERDRIGSGDEFPVIDKSLPMEAVLASIRCLARGLPVITLREAQMHRLEAMQRARAGRANLEAATLAARNVEAPEIAEPLPSRVSSVLDRLKTRLAG